MATKETWVCISGQFDVLIFLSDPDSTRRESPKEHQQSPRPEPTQEVTSLLLLAIFAIAARFCEDEMPLPPTGKMWEAGCGYLDLARGLLGVSQIIHPLRHPSHN
jgi:hypothetical protein